MTIWQQNTTSDGHGGPPWHDKHLAKARKLDGELHPHGDQGLLGTAEMAINSHDLLNNDDFNLNFCKLPHHSVNAMRGIEIQKAIQGKTVFIKLFFNG